MSVEPVMSSFLSNFLSLELIDETGSSDSKIIECTQIISGKFWGSRCFSILDIADLFHRNLSGPAASRWSKKNAMTISKDSFKAG